MKMSRSGMTLFELLIVMTIVGIIYSIGLFTLKKEHITAPTLNLTTLKTTLLALSQSGEIRLNCDTSCHECRIISNDDTLLTTANLKATGVLQRYGFNRFGELTPWGKVVTQSKGEMSQGCFEMTLHPDGSTTPLILKSDTTFYAYTPLGGNKPYITQSEEELQKFIFNEALYPLKGDDIYGAQ
ncbi:MAG: type II secretion system protein [Sulfuricurvum sp.]|uniref:type II secretion system protein n=1 Tax=Sulfuricurvum sp. TaxID=2025608 RepID=UPI002612E659|nr:type II secretion system protein [Sulfuricurvum sp.]MDD2828316.1 type II secretion system protein [Sulfuricurvum sp.]MDD4949729.1 type II secretion system protein [Sulfuricurvum sp.]